MSMWYFNRKRDPGGKLFKKKLYCVLMEVCISWGMDYWETYSPVGN